MLGKRIFTVLIGLPIAIFIVLQGGLTFLITLGVLSLIGLHEFYIAAAKKRLPVHIVGYAFIPVYYYFVMTSGDPLYLLLTCAALLLVTLVCLVLFYKTVNFMDCAVTIFGFYYIPVLFSFAYLAREYHLGSFFVWLIFICAWGSDTGAYVFGRLFGKHKLAPSLSPNKTIAGAIGGVLTATLLAFAYGTIMMQFLLIDGRLPIVMICTIAGVMGSIFSQFGDLAASAIKRHSDIKDFGKIFPGHGGVMDRFDSMLFTAPVVFGLMWFLV